MALIELTKSKLSYYKQKTECTISSHDSLNNDNGYDYILSFSKDAFSCSMHLDEAGMMELYEHLARAVKEPPSPIVEEVEEDNREDMGYEKERQRKLDAES